MEYITKFDVTTSVMVLSNIVVNDIYIEYDGICGFGWDILSHFLTGRLNMVDVDWSEKVKGILKAELKKRNVSYKQLAELLATLGVYETDRNIANKLARGGFSAAFLVQCLSAIGCETVHLEI
jgi:hypothetical protein